MTQAANHSDTDNLGQRPPYGLEERTAQFGQAIIEFARTVRVDVVTRPLISQLVRAGTSVGANYLEANDSESPRDLRHKAALCRKESREVKHWLRMIVTAAPQTRDPARPLWQEAKELNLIFSSIVRKVTKELERQR